MRIEFKNGSYITAISDKKGDNIRGKRANFILYCDNSKMKWYQKLKLKLYKWLNR